MTVALVMLGVFWLALGVVLLFAPDELFRSAAPRMRRYAAAGCFVFSLFCLLGLSV